MSDCKECTEVTRIAHKTQILEEKYNQLKETMDTVKDNIKLIDKSVDKHTEALSESREKHARTDEKVTRIFEAIRSLESTIVKLVDQITKMNGVLVVNDYQTQRVTSKTDAFTTKSISIYIAIIGFFIAFIIKMLFGQ